MEPRKKGKVTLVVFSGELDKALAAFVIAIGAASMGMEVTMYFTFWGLNVVRKNSSLHKPKGWMKRMLGLLNRGGADRLILSKFHMGGMGTGMMKTLMKQSRMASVPEMIAMAKELGVIMIGCTTSMDMLGVHKDDLIDAVDKTAGVATYLNTARDGNVDLFI